MKATATLFILLALLISSPNYGRSQAAVQKTSDDSAVFEPVIPLLQKKTDVPLRLPTYLATEDETYPLHAIVEVATPTRYELQLAFTPDCTGGTACRYGMVSGRALRRGARRPRGRSEGQKTDS